MGLTSSLFTGVSGLDAFGTALSVISNNIGGVSTVGFKGGSASFGDVFAASQAGLQVGRGVSTQQVRSSFSQGSFENTGNALDLAIDGGGFFAVRSKDGQDFYTRAGTFSVDQNGFIETPGGMTLQGRQADGTGKLTATIGKINVAATTSQPKASTIGTFVENLDARDPVGTLTTLNGTVNAVAVGATTLTGTNTAFTTQLVPGDQILIGGNKLTVASIESNTSLTLTAAVPASVAVGTVGVTAAGATTLTASAGTFANVAAGDSILIGTDTYTVKSVPSTTTLLLNTPVVNSIVAGTAVTKGGAIGALSIASARSANFSTGITMYDSIGNGHLVSVLFSKTGDDVWEFNAVVDKKDAFAGASQVQAFGSMVFETNGALKTLAALQAPGGTLGFDFSGGVAQDQQIAFDFGTTTTTGTGLNGITQFASSSAVLNQTQDGFSPGSLQSVAVDREGIISGLFTNGRSRTLGQVTLARFNNQDGLVHIGGNLFAESVESGQALIGVPNSAGAGKIQASSLEMSNVDIAQQFTKMIEYQRGFQANSRVITTTDDLLQEVVNLKR